MNDPNAVCLNPAHQDREVYIRGLCPSCYQSACGLVKKKVVTWEQLIDNGKALPTKGTKSGTSRNWLLEGVK